MDTINNYTRTTAINEGHPRQTRTYGYMLISDFQGYPDRQGKLGSKTYSFSPSQVGNKCHGSQEHGPGHGKNDRTLYCGKVLPGMY